MTFWGAAQTVTGSLHRVEAGGRLILLDCGSFRGRRDEARLRNRSLPFRASDVDAVVLSHAHADHCGNLPELVRQGFHGPIYCTPATRDLVEVMLADSARFREEDVRVARILRGPAARDDNDDDLDEGDGLSINTEPCPRELANQAALQCLAVPLEREVEIFPGIRLCFVRSGHILGSAMVRLTFDVGDQQRSLVFTGDIGRRGLPYLSPPAPIPEADVVISESTYGGRVHPSREEMAEAMAAVGVRVAEQGGKLLIPAFSLGRTQLVVHYLNRWMKQGLMPRLPIFVDGPLASSIADIYRDHPDELVDPTAYPLDGSVKNVTHVLPWEESRQLSGQRGSCVIVASSGMCDGGRILHHLKHNLDDPRCSVVLVSYQAPQTLGARLLEPRPSVRFHGRDWNVWAEVLKLDGFSGHAGHDDLMDYFRPLLGRARKVRLVHGEIDAARALEADLRGLGFPDVTVPAPGDQVILDETS